MLAWGKDGKCVLLISVFYNLQSSNVCTKAILYAVIFVIALLICYLVGDRCYYIL